MGEVHSLLTPSEFARRAVGLPWVRWRSDWQAMDCYGCIVLYFREVLGVELGDVPQTDIAQGFSVAHGWIECGAEAGATCFMAWRDGAPTHCGVLLSPREVLHSEGSDEHPGSVRVSRLEAMRRVYGEVRFYRYAPC
jgi:cell wall-associated NlpC family hydrolase